MNSNWTGRFPRTTAEALGCDGHAIYLYKTPPHKRFFFALIKHGWWVAFLAVVLLTGCVDMQSEEDTAAAFRDALAQQQAGRPDLWNAAQKKRGDVAAGIVAKEYGHE